MHEFINNYRVTPIEPFYIELGKRVCSARAVAGLTQERLGAALKPAMTRAAIANIEAGKQRVLAKTLVDLAKALNVDVTALIPGQTASRRSSPAKPDPKVIQAELAKELKLSPEKVKALAKQLETAEPRGNR